MEFPRQEYWSALPFPTPGHLPHPGIEPRSLKYPALAGRFFISSAGVPGFSVRLRSAQKYRKKNLGVGEVEEGQGEEGAAQRRG